MTGDDMGDEDGCEWRVYREHVLAELKRISKNVDALVASDLCIRVDIGKLKLAAAIWGSVAGTLGAMIIMLVYTLLTS
jgi:hypothetical protein